MVTTTLPRPATTGIDALGPFDLDAATRFLAGFTPAARPDAAEEKGTLRMAFPVERGWEHSGALIRQRAPGTVEVSLQVAGDAAERAARQVRRILSLDVDGRRFPALARADPVVAVLQARFPGLRPVLFPSP